MDLFPSRWTSFLPRRLHFSQTGLSFHLRELFLTRTFVRPRCLLLYAVGSLNEIGRITYAKIQTPEGVIIVFMLLGREHEGSGVCLINQPLILWILPGSRHFLLGAST
jgi:hypothetical protein